MHAQDARSDAVVWTRIIPEGFPHNIYAWRLSVDGIVIEWPLSGNPIASVCG
jgi:hypothetical protein